MQKTIAILIFSLLFTSSSFASVPKCKLLFAKEKLCAEIHWVKEPKAVEMPTEKDKAEFTLEFIQTVWTKEPLKQDPKHDVSVGIYMPSMDHGSMPVKLTHKGNGVYEVSDVYFTMSGDWEINIKLVDSTTHKIFEQAKFPYTLK